MICEVTDEMVDRFQRAYMGASGEWPLADDVRFALEETLDVSAVERETDLLNRAQRRLNDELERRANESDRVTALGLIDDWKARAEAKEAEAAEAYRQRNQAVRQRDEAYRLQRELMVARDLCKTQTAAVEERRQATAYALRCVLSLCNDDDLVSLDFSLDEAGEHLVVEALRAAREPGSGS